MKNDPYSTEWTPEEIENLPQTTAVFDTPQLKADEHVWVQQGLEILDVCSPRTMACLVTGISIGPGRLLVKEDGKYKLIDETRPHLDEKRNLHKKGAKTAKKTKRK